MLRAYLGVVVAIAVSACGATPNDDAAHARKNINGFGEIMLGAPLQVVLDRRVTETLSPLGMQACLQDLPLKGCFLSPRDSSTPFIIAEGIPFALSLSFNRLDKLTDIDLSYERETVVSREQCLELHDRTLDWLSKDYGVFAEPTVNDNESWMSRTTGAGHRYSIGNVDGGGFVTRPKRTLRNPGEMSVRPRAIPKWNDDRYVWLLGSYIGSSDRTCRITIGFSEPGTVERRKD